MPIACPVCGKWSSDPENCEHCRADMRSPTAPRPPSVCPLVDPGIHLSASQLAILGHPESALHLVDGDRAFRVHWLDKGADPDWHDDWRRRQRIDLRCLPQHRVVDVELGTWIFVEASGQTPAPWLARRGDNALEDLERLVAYAVELADLFETLHGRDLFWMNFDPAELDRGPDGRLRVANLDLRVFFRGETPHALSVHQSYAGPEVVYLKAADLGPRTDVYHLSVFCYHWLAGFLPNGVPGEGLEAVDFQLPPLRTYHPEMVEGAARVIARGMAPEARHRYAEPRVLAEQLAAVLDQARLRRAFKGRTTWETGFHTRTGRTKAALKRGNEDQALVHRYANPDRALLIIADGITTCDIGSGALASLISTIVIENELEYVKDPADFTPRITAACLQCSRKLVEWALEKGHRDELLAGRDLMGSTLTAGWLQGNLLQIANLGDSRAYLIANNQVEQLTVDGDVGSDLLAEGVAPEEVRELGGMIKALRKCIGGCEVRPDDTIAVVEDACVPTIASWPLLPGDLIVLCSDGLVEEGAFLEPEVLVEIVRNHPNASAQELALLFADAADALQRVPSSFEPDGFGDNIACVVLKVS